MFIEANQEAIKEQKYKTERRLGCLEEFHVQKQSLDECHSSLGNQIEILEQRVSCIEADLNHVSEGIRQQASTQRLALNESLVSEKMARAY